jgi:hypothetical protein
MKTFTIENETNNITVHASAKESESVHNAERFSSESALAKLAANWPASRLIEIWNSLPGETPVKKFKDRATAVSRIWKALQPLGKAVQPEAVIPESPEPTRATPVAPQTPDVAPQASPAKNKATRAKKTSAATVAAAPREGSKISRVIAMLKREGGATLDEIMTSMGWQKHTTRAMLSAGGSLTKNHGLVITSEKVGDKRTYSIKA